MGDPIGRESVHSEISVSHAFHSCYLWLSKSRGDSSLGAWWLYEHALRRTAGPSLVARPCPGAPLLHFGQSSFKPRVASYRTSRRSSSILQQREILVHPAARSRRRRGVPGVIRLKIFHVPVTCVIRRLRLCELLHPQTLGQRTGEFRWQERIVCCQCRLFDRGLHRRMGGLRHPSPCCHAGNDPAIR